MTIAFNGQASVKEDALVRMRAHISAGTFRYSPPWSEKGGSAMGLIIEGNDPQLYAERLGYPLPLVAVLDNLVNDRRGGLAEASKFALAWLERTPVGADLTPIVGQALIAILSDPALSDISATAPPIEAQRQAVLALHRRALAGEEIPASEWKKARKAATAANDALPEDDKILRTVARTIESAAWPATMRSVLTDALSARGRLDINLALQEIGWTDDDERRVYSIMEAAEGRETHLEGLERVYAVIAAEDPAFAERAKVRTAQHQKFTAHGNQFGDFLLDALAAAGPQSSRDSGDPKRSA
jgi:hypothetical protein